MILRLRLTRVPPDSRGGTCPWAVPRRQARIAREGALVDHQVPHPDHHLRPRPLAHPARFSCNIPSRPPFSIPRCVPPHLGTFAAPARCRDSPRKVEKSGQEKRLHYKSDSSAISSIFASSSGSTSPSSSEFDAMNWAAHCKSSFVRNAPSFQSDQPRSPDRCDSSGLSQMRRTGRTVSPVDVTAERGSQLTYCVEVAAELLADVEEQTVRSVHQAQRPGRESPALFGAFWGVVILSGRHCPTPSPCPSWPAACAPSWDKIPFLLSVASSVTC